MRERCYFFFGNETTTVRWGKARLTIREDQEITRRTKQEPRCSVGSPEEVLKAMMTGDGGIEDRGEVAGRSKNSHSTQPIHPFVIITVPLPRISPHQVTLHVCNFDLSCKGKRGSFGQQTCFECTGGDSSARGREMCFFFCVHWVGVKAKGQTGRRTPNTGHGCVVHFGILPSCSSSIPTSRQSDVRVM